MYTVAIATAKQDTSGEAAELPTGFNLVMNIKSDYIIILREAIWNNH
jgi:hypothetical protein